MITETSMAQPSVNHMKTIFTIAGLLLIGVVFWFVTVPLLLRDDSWSAGVFAAVITLFSFKPFIDARWMD